MSNSKPPEIITYSTSISVSSSPKKTPTTATTQTSNYILESIIRIIGKPPAQSSEKVGNLNHIAPSPEPDTEIDVLDAMNEDPFTLESLEDLIRFHSEKNLDFILARVTTEDPDDSSRLYYSYYAAHHINKILFRTEFEKGLLHRMKAKNVYFN